MIDYNKFVISEMNITNRCNAKCRFCVRQNHTPDEIKDMDLNIIQNLPNFAKIYLSSYNSEPTLHPQFIEIIKIFKEKNIDVHLYSNMGTHDEKWWFNLGKSLTHVTSHLDGIGKNHEKHKVGLCFNKVVSNMKSFTKAGGKLYLKTIVFKYNENDVDEIKNLSKEIGVQKHSLKASWEYEIDGDFSKPLNYFIMNRSEKSIQNKDKIICELDLGALAIDIDGNYYPCCRMLDRENIGILHVPYELKNLMKNSKESNELKEIKKALDSEFFKYIKKNKENIKRCNLSCRGGYKDQDDIIDIKYKEMDIDRIIRKNIINTYYFYKNRFPFISLAGLEKLSHYHNMSLDKLKKIWGTNCLKSLYNLIINNKEIGDSFCYSQYRCKNWMYNVLKSHIKQDIDVLICAGWTSMFTRFLIRMPNVRKIKSIDKNPSCKEISEYIFKDKRFSADTFDVFDYKEYNDYDVIINTSCEHMNYVKWLELIPKGKIVVLQNTNNKNIEDHKFCVSNLDEFINSLNLNDILYKNSIKIYNNIEYDRYMVIGIK